MINKVLCLGTGKVGTMVALLLSEQFEVTAMDKQVPPDLPFHTLTGDIGDVSLMEETISKF
ncbi:MAG: Saccharopine dehydrogenase-like oxidoreductase, partial [Pedobacter sp.]|nr:Saccharopine dehydrogenase-like oxidoreductase [Pedobacter sp.]